MEISLCKYILQMVIFPPVEHNPFYDKLIPSQVCN